MDPTNARTSPPGRIVNHLSSDTGQFVGSPSVAILPDGVILASHDIFGPRSSEHQSGITLVFRSHDDGQTWAQVSIVQPAFWSSLFVYDGAVYLFGTTHHHGLVVIRRSTDAGTSWSVPDDMDTGLLTLRGQFHTAPMPMLFHEGRVWRAVEDATSGTVWGRRYNPMMMSAPIGTDLLRRESWRFSEVLFHLPGWLGGRFGGWLEGNAIDLPDGRVADMLRVDYAPGGKAALVVLNPEENTLEFSPKNGFVDLPGGATKFSLRRDPESPDKSPVYWTLTNAVPQDHASDKPNHAGIRNTLVLYRSTDLHHWEPRSVVLYHPDSHRHAFQYADWTFERNDIVAVCRTAWEDDRGGAPNEHDANYLTFHRIPDFRRQSIGDSPFDYVL